jgi:glycosyltransferase involved in cell wall biosynthesis
VKQPRFPLRPLERLRGRFPGLVLLYAGPVLEPDEADALFAELAGRPWARYLGAVPHPLMPALLERADVVLNCSLAEGGMANSVLEALALGRAVLASGIDGNRSVIEDGVTGLLYRGEADFAERAAALLGDPGLRRRLGEASRRYVASHLAPDRELDGYLAVYAQLAGGAAEAPGN